MPIIRDRLAGILRSGRAGLARAHHGISVTERQRLFALTVAVGGLCGLAAVAFHLAIDALSRVAIDRAVAAPGHSWIGWTLLVPTAGGLLCGVLLQYVVPQARGSGIPEIKVVYTRRTGEIRLRDAVGKFVVSALQIGTGSSLGREGPTVQICAGMSGRLARLSGLSPRNVRRLLPVGAAAGIAAAFNAPIAAVTFTIEEIVGQLDQTILSGVIVAAALAAIVERSVLGEHPMLITIQSRGAIGAGSLALYAGLGVAASGLAVGFTDSLLRLRAWFRDRSRIPGWLRPAVGGLATGLLAVVGLLTLGATGIAGGGYATLAQALGGELPVLLLLGCCALKLVATVVSYSSGGAGGIFAPSLFIGGMLGGAFGALDVTIFHHPPEVMGDFALVGMGAMFAGVIRAPITSVLIIIEMTGGYALILPLMIANMSAYGLARLLRPSAIYDALLEQDGIRLRQRAAEPQVRIPLGEIALSERPFATLAPASTAATMLETSGRHDRQEVFPVVSASGALLGIIAIEDLVTLAAESPREGLINAADLMRPANALGREDDVRQAFDAMRAAGVTQLPVIDAERHVLGLIDEGAIARAYLRATTLAQDQEASDPTVRSAG